ncbi:pyridoxal 5'-phosphate synthase glutaminase subunit PdxT [Dermacoccus barathri]|uniref:Pyridoxal 5'-phosphate synthase subunit PdxT n=1 Tax=Dermacoccus barathri TaxID=322601 RepID=A0ABN2BRI3_9MICO
MSVGGTPGPGVTIGVLALQGDVREHLAALSGAGAHAVRVRTPEELDAVDGLVLPGGESTTMEKLLRAFGLREPLVERIDAGMPVYGSCAGMILLADEILDGAPGQRTLGGLPITVRRNAFGRQVDSFECDLAMPALEGDGPVRAVFVRAPWVEEVGPDVEVLARVPEGNGVASDRVVAVRRGDLLATSFHPEITGDHRVHAYFTRVVRERVNA